MAPDLKSIPEYEGLYSISENGEVWSHLTQQWRAHGIGQTGYHMVTLRLEGNRVTEYIHELMLRTFVGPRPEGLKGLHKDDNKDNNSLSNLYWGTSKDNAKDALLNGITHVGEDNHMSKVTEQDVQEIRAAYANGISQALLTRHYGIQQATISNIVNRNTWKHVLDLESVRPENMPRIATIAAGSNRVVNEELVREIRNRFALGESQSALSRELDIHQTTISLIVRRRTWAHVE